MKDAKPGEPFVPVVHKRDANGARLDDAQPAAAAARAAYAQAVDPQRSSIAGNEFLVAYVPGIQPQSFVLGDSAKLIPAGSDIVLQMHYTANGQAADGRYQGRAGAGERDTEASLPDYRCLRYQSGDPTERSQL